MIQHLHQHSYISTVTTYVIWKLAQKICHDNHSVTIQNWQKIDDGARIYFKRFQQMGRRSICLHLRKILLRVFISSSLIALNWIPWNILHDWDFYLFEVLQSQFYFLFKKDGQLLAVIGEKVLRHIEESVLGEGNLNKIWFVVMWEHP
jgi:hypothetical protein